MNNYFKKIISVSLLSCACFTLKPISETTANVGAAVGGLVVGGGAATATYFLGFNNTNNRTARWVTTALVGLGVTGITWYALYQFLHSLTPRGRFTAAQAIVGRASMDSLISKQFITVEDFISHITARFGTSWPLVVAREYLMTMSNSLLAARDLLNKAYFEVQADPAYGMLCSQCTQLNQQITNIFSIIESHLTIISKHEKYDIQIKLYEKHQEAERQRQHELSLQNNALWHDSLENSKKQQHQNQILQQNPHRPVTLNVG